MPKQTARTSTSKQPWYFPRPRTFETIVVDTSFADEEVEAIIWNAAPNAVVAALETAERNSDTVKIDTDVYSETDPVDPTPGESSTENPISWEEEEMENFEYNLNRYIQSRPKYDCEELEKGLERLEKKRTFDAAFYKDNLEYSKMSDYKHGCSAIPFVRSSGNENEVECLIQPLEEYGFVT